MSSQRGVYRIWKIQPRWNAYLLLSKKIAGVCDVYTLFPYMYGFVAYANVASPAAALPACTIPFTIATPYPPIAALCSVAAIAGVPPTVDCKSANAPPCHTSDLKRRGTTGDYGAYRLADHWQSVLLH